MKGNTKITLEIQDESGAFAITETYTIARDNTYESVDEWVDVFKKILYLVGFDPVTINEVFEVQDADYEDTDNKN